MSFDYTAADKLREIKREIGLRMTLYPRWVEVGKLSKEKAAMQLDILRAIARDYEAKQ